jgi:hypothetical protein
LDSSDFLYTHLNLFDSLTATPAAVKSIAEIAKYRIVRGIYVPA